MSRQTEWDSVSLCIHFFILSYLKSRKKGKKERNYERTLNNDTKREEEGYRRVSLFCFVFLPVFHSLGFFTAFLS